LYTSSALAMAAREGRLENLAWLLDQGVDPDLGGGVALISAVGLDRPRAVEMLIARGADVNRVQPRTGVTALLHAATKHPARDRAEQNLEVIEVLLAAGADPAHRPEGGQYRGRTAVEYLRDQRVKSLERIEKNPYGEAQQQAEQRLVDHRDAIIAVLERSTRGVH
jgi:ankyrin repeat protein